MIEAERMSVYTELAGTEVPAIFSRAEMRLFAKGYLDTLAVQYSPEFVSQVEAILTSPELQEEIQAGRVTLAMIKPDLSNDSVCKGSDAETAEAIKASIPPELQVIFDVSVQMTPELADQFYSGGPKEKQSTFPAFDPTRYGREPGEEWASRWEEYLALMTRGPVTMMLLYEPNGEAISTWRQKMGDNWNIQQLVVDDPTSLRARFARPDQNHNNLLHGSDSPESVQREIGLMLELLKHYDQYRSNA